jgi:uncharacterized protein (DUF885 family)
VIAFHEAVPGHHLQRSVAQQLSQLPLVRRAAPVNVYVEGWGLYAERLADEMGLYTSELDRLGMLAMDSLRAGRLVVDTGLHAKGWSRSQAIGYLPENTPLPDWRSSPKPIATSPTLARPCPIWSVAWRSNACAPRRRAPSVPAGFDIKAFHDVVLGSGSLPLGVLDDVVSAWITSR